MTLCRLESIKQTTQDVPNSFSGFQAVLPESKFCMLLWQLQAKVFAQNKGEIWRNAILA